MVQWQNYMAGLMGSYTWGMIGLAFLYPPGVVVFVGSIYPFNLGWLLLHPKVARWIANLRDQIWIFIDVAKNALWDYDNSQLQLWFDEEPWSVPIEDAFGNFVEWLTFVTLKVGFRHPKYNGGQPEIGKPGRAIYGVYLKHGDYSFRHMGMELSEDERKSLSAWSKLFPKGGGYVMFTAQWVKHRHSDRTWGKEVIPSAEELRLAEEAMEEGTELLNNVPIVMDGIAYPVIEVARATGSSQIEDELRVTHPVIQQPLEEPKTEVDVVPLPIIRVRRRATAP